MQIEVNLLIDLSRLLKSIQSFVISMKHDKLSHSKTYVSRTNLVQTLKTIKHKKYNNLKKNNLKAALKHNKQNQSNASRASLSYKMIDSKTSNDGSIKKKYDQMMNQIFMKIDFDCSGFITGTKIAYYKQMPQKIYYFLGGVFQKVRQLGTVTFKMFESLCNEEFMHASAKDIDAIFANNSFSTKNFSRIEESHNSRCKMRISLNKNRCKTDHFQKENCIESQAQFFTKKIEKIQSQKKYSLKIHQKFSEEIQQKDQKTGRNNRKSIDKKLNYSMEKDSLSGYQNVSFQSQKVKILTQRLNRQIQQSSQRLYKNRLIS